MITEIATTLSSSTSEYLLREFVEKSQDVNVNTSGDGSAILTHTSNTRFPCVAHCGQTISEHAMSICVLALLRLNWP